MKLANFIVQKNATVLDAASIMDSNAKKIVFICDGMRLLASFTDGDLRRVLLRSGDLTQPVVHVANKKPLSVYVGENTKAKRLLEEKPFMNGIPLLNAVGEITSIEFVDKACVRQDVRLGVPVVIMAGGKGTRLAPYTDVLPKPLIPVGDMTITEHIMDRFLRFGCDDFIMIVNHKKGLIKAYFSETPYGGNLRYIDEEEPLGTGGGLKLLEGVISKTYFFTNCDILVFADYSEILKVHDTSENIITLVCVKKKIVIPYGTVDVNDCGALMTLIEKPQLSFLTNSGFYIVSPKFHERIKPNIFTPITEIIQQCIDDGERVGVYQIAEDQWSDMGQLEEMEKMQKRLIANQ